MALDLSREEFERATGWAIRPEEDPVEGMRR
jgi:hypothetical protein